jgi:hypothetical protein
MLRPTPLRRAALLVGTLLPLVGGTARAQGSPYIPTDDPSLPLLEHLIARGDVRDPSPMVRPLVAADVLRALATADSTATLAGDSATRRIVAELRSRWGAEAAAGGADRRPTWTLRPRAGLQAATADRRDPLDPTGDGGAWPYAELEAGAVFGPLVLRTRPAVEPRLVDDPDYPGRRDVEVSTRLIEGYLAGRFRYGSFLYGQQLWNWGPVGLPGIPLSDYGYERQGLAFSVGVDRLRLSAFATELGDEVDSLGRTVHRYYFAHRLDARVSDRLHLALWEGLVNAGVDRNFETRHRNPLSIGYLANTLGIGDRGNELLGLDVTWRALRRHTLLAQLALDDFWYQNREANRDRWAFTVGATGPFPGGASYRALYTQVSSLALRTFNQFESFSDRGVGLGRDVTDHDRLSLWVSRPVGASWLLTPELTVQRRGEGRLDTPYPTSANGELAGTPALFIGTVERTYRAALGVSGRQGPVELGGVLGVNHVTSAGHVAGASRTVVEGRLQVTIGHRWTGTLPEPDF